MPSRLGDAKKCCSEQVASWKAKSRPRPCAGKDPMPEAPVAVPTTSQRLVSGEAASLARLQHPLVVGWYRPPEGSCLHQVQCWVLNSSGVISP